jgi:hypothetical protein
MGLTAFMFEKILLLAALLAFAFGCRTVANRYAQKLAFVLFLVCSYLLGLWLSGSHVGGAVAVLGWFLLPWLEITRIRSVPLPARQEIKSRFPPNAEIFPELPELTEEAEERGFESKDDVGWKWEDTSYFMRLMLHPGAHTRAALCQASQQDFYVSFVAVSSRVKDGRTYTTTNYPFPDSMKSAPDQVLNRYSSAMSLEDLLVNHELFLDLNALEVSDLMPWDEEQMTADLDTERQGQITHNLKVGVLEQVDEDHLRYSWRGCFFLWCEVVKDMIRI